jgi:hypothetical protein
MRLAGRCLLPALLIAAALLACIAHGQGMAKPPAEAGAAAAYFHMSLSYAPAPVYPGSVIQLYITLVSSQPLSDVHIDIDSPFKVLTGTRMYIRQLAAGAPYVTTALVQVPLDARPGTYTIKASAYSLLFSTSASVDVEVFPLDFSALAIVLPSVYIAGQPVYMPVRVVNPTADQVKATVTVRGPAATQYLNASLSCDAVILPRSNATCLLYFSLARDLKPGLYNITLVVTMRSASGYAGSVTFTKTVQLPIVGGIDVNVAAVPAQPVVAGSPALVTLLLSQTGPVTPQNVTVRVLSGDGVRVLSNVTVTVPLLTQLQIPIQLVATRHGAVRVPVELCLFTGACIVKYADLYVPAPAVSVNAIFNPPRGYPGSVVQAAFVISANYTVNDVEVRVRAPFKITSGASARFPALLPQAPATVNTVFEIPDGVRPGVYPVEVSAAGLNFTFYYEVLGPEFGVSLAFSQPVTYPGGVVSGTLVVAAPFTARNVTIRISTPLVLESPSEYYIPLLPYGQPYTAIVVLRVPDSTAPGRYPVTVSVSGYNRTFYLTVDNPHVIVQNVIVIPPRLLEGVYAAQVQVQVLNTGPAVARNFTVALLNATMGRNSYTIDFLPPGTPLTLTFYLDASGLRPGNYVIVAAVRSGGGERVAAGPLEVRKKNTFAVKHRVYNAAPGSTATLVLEVTNAGPAEARSVRVTVTPSQVFEPHASNIAYVMSASMRVLGDMPPGATATAAFLLDVSDKAVPGTYPLVAVITWNQTDVLIPGVQYVEIPVEVRGVIEPVVAVPLALAAAIAVAGAVIFLRRRRGGLRR